MICYLKNQKVVRRWIQSLYLILRYQKLGVYEHIVLDKKLLRIIEVLEEYDDIIFKEDLNE